MNVPHESSAEHDAVWNLLPWYLNGTLDEAEATRVREHIARCLACRDEAGEQEVIRANIADADSRPERAPAAFSMLMDRIDTTSEEDLAGRDEAATTARATWPAALRLAAVLAVTASIWALTTVRNGTPEPSPTNNEFTVLGDPSACVGDLSVVFDPAATDAAIRELLRSEGLEIACGPTPENLYKLRLGDRQSQASTATRLRAEGIVQLVLASD